MLRLVTWGWALLALPLLAAPRADAATSNQTARENARPGTHGWNVAASSGRAIEGYASALSVVAGRSLALHVSTTPAARYRVEVFRLGWYGGVGARLVACVPGCVRDRLGRPRPVPPPARKTGEVAAAWPVTDAIHTSIGWASGEYLAQLVLVGRGRPWVGRAVPFVVRPAREMRDSVLVEVPVNTWEAYNSWGGKSLYAFNSSGGVPAVMVSFARPWAYGDPNLTFPVVFEYPMLRFLERSGFPLEYVTDVDVQRHSRLLLEHRLSVLLGHGEYWSKRIRDAWAAARRAGRDLAFLGANIGYWQIRYAGDDRTIVEYRSRAADPDADNSEKTTQFRALDPPRPECALLGVEFQGGGLHPPLVHSYTVVAQHNPWLLAAGLRPGNRLRAAVQGEWDATIPGCGSPPPTVLLRYAGADPAEATLTHTASGGQVLALGTEGFGSLVDAWGESCRHVVLRAQRFLRAALSGLSGVSSERSGHGPPSCPAIARRHERRRRR